MNPQQLEGLNALWSVVGIMGLIWMWARLWRPLALNQVRQDLFDLRDEFFDRVRTGESHFTFEDETYQTVRNDLNAMIRFVRPFGIGELICQRFLRHRAAAARGQGPCKVTKIRLSDEQVAELKMISRRQRHALVRFLAGSSLSFWVVALAMLFVALLLGLRDLLERRAAHLGKHLRDAFMKPLTTSMARQAGQSLLAS